MEWLCLGVILAVLVALVRNWGPPDAIMLGAVVALGVTGVLTPRDALAGFANEGMLTVAGLFVVTAAMRETGALDLIGQRMLGGARTSGSALSRMCLWLPVISGFLNNTPIVAMMLPVVTDWCRRNRISPSRLLIPLSFITVLGGMLTLVGTSTNLVVRGLIVQSRSGAEGAERMASLSVPGLFDITPLGLICVLVGCTYLLLFSKRLLPDRRELLEQFGQSFREYMVDLRVEPGCRLIGKSIEEAGLRNLPQLFLIEVERNGEVISPVAPNQLLEANDRLTFTGVVRSIVDLEKIPGLVPVADDGYRSDEIAARTRNLCEAVISPSSPVIGKTIREAEFRSRYNAAVIAVHRNGERLGGRVGDIQLRAGDTLLLQTGIHFHRAHRNDPDFILVSGVEDSRPRRHARAPIALGLVAGLMVLLAFADAPVTLGSVSFQLPPVVISTFAIAGLLVATRCTSVSTAREGVDWQTLICIAASFGLGKALDVSGAAHLIAEWLQALTGGGGPIAMLAAVYLVTMLLTELLTNNAAAALMFPLSIELASQMQVSPQPFVIAIMFAASLAFATPIGYQTNLMVYGPGGYRFTDFTRIGLPLNVLMWLVAVLFIPVFWPFQPR